MFGIFKKNKVDNKAVKSLQGLRVHTKNKVDKQEREISSLKKRLDKVEEENRALSNNQVEFASVSLGLIQRLSALEGVKSQLSEPEKPVDRKEVIKEVVKKVYVTGEEDSLPANFRSMKVKDLAALFTDFLGVKVDIAKGGKSLTVNDTPLRIAHYKKSDNTYRAQYINKDSYLIIPDIDTKKLYLTRVVVRAVTNSGYYSINRNNKVAINNIRERSKTMIKVLQENSK